MKEYKKDSEVCEYIEEIKLDWRIWKDSLEKVTF